MSKEKKYRIGTYLRAKRSTTVGNSIRENAKLPLQQPMMTVRGTAYISRTHGIRMHIQKKSITREQAGIVVH